MNWKTCKAKLSRQGRNKGNEEIHQRNLTKTKHRMIAKYVPKNKGTNPGTNPGVSKNKGANPGTIPSTHPGTLTGKGPYAGIFL